MYEGHGRSDLEGFEPLLNVRIPVMDHGATIV